MRSVARRSAFQRRENFDVVFGIVGRARIDETVVPPRLSSTIEYVPLPVMRVRRVQSARGTASVDVDQDTGDDIGRIVLRFAYVRRDVLVRRPNLRTNRTKVLC